LLDTLILLALDVGRYFDVLAANALTIAPGAVASKAHKVTFRADYAPSSGTDSLDSPTRTVVVIADIGPPPPKFLFKFYLHRKVFPLAEKISLVFYLLSESLAAPCDALRRVAMSLPSRE
jgi:hypothetical protein